MYDVIILGAGASGLFCASRLKNKKVLILEGNTKPGLKLLASGGGLCNFYNADLSYKDYQSRNPRFCISALSSHRLEDFKIFLKEHKVNFTQRSDGKLFASSSKAVLDALLDSLPSTAEMRLACKFEKALKKENIFEVSAGGAVFKAANLICALGGPSYPALGASAAAYALAESFGHAIIPPYPALCGIVFTGPLKERFADTAGISLEAELACDKNKFGGGLLFTHDGLSGPALFQLSLYGIKGKEIKINFAPKTDIAAFIRENKNGAKNISSILEELLPARLVKALLNGFDKKSADLNKKEIQLLASLFNSFGFTVQKLTGYQKAEITAGGISVEEISSKTMESKKTQGLYFTGECLDVSGKLGGYNLAWAWASAAAAAKDISSK